MLEKFAKLVANVLKSTDLNLASNSEIGYSRQVEWAGREVSFTKIKEGSFVRSKFNRHPFGKKMKKINSGVVVKGPYIYKEKKTVWAAVDILANNGELCEAIPISEIVLNFTE